MGSGPRTQVHRLVWQALWSAKPSQDLPSPPIFASINVHGQTTEKYEPWVTQFHKMETHGNGSKKPHWSQKAQWSPSTWEARLGNSVPSHFEAIHLLLQALTFKYIYVVYVQRWSSQLDKCLYSTKGSDSTGERVRSRQLHQSLNHASCWTN